MDIISKRTGPRREDVKARALIESNRGTITQLADTLTGGGYSARKAAAAQPKEPQAQGLIFSDLGAGRQAGPARPYIRISPNGRVTAVDIETNRQLHHLGEIRRLDGRSCFVVATKANGFFSAVASEIAEPLAALDGAVMGGARTDQALAAEIAALLGYPAD